MSDGTTVRLPRLIGMSRTLDLLLTGRAVSAREALEMGLANRLVPAGESLAEARRLAAHITGFPPLALAADRGSVYRQAGLPLAEALTAEAEGAQTAKQQEAQQGGARFAAGEGRHGKTSGR